MNKLNSLRKTPIVLILYGVLLNYHSYASITDFNLQICGDNRYDSNQRDTTFAIVPSSYKTYGYEILVGMKVLIKQLNIPGVQGTQGFKTKGDATKVARLVIKKLSRGLMPPTIEKKELTQLRIQFKP